MCIMLHSVVPLDNFEIARGIVNIKEMEDN